METPRDHGHKKGSAVRVGGIRQGNGRQGIANGRARVMGVVFGGVHQYTYLTRKSIRKLNRRGIFFGVGFWDA